MSRTLILLFSVIALTLTGCATYTISTPSLLEQFANAGTERKVVYTYTPPFFFSGSVNGNDLRTIKAMDKNNKEHEFRVTNHTGVRITRNDGKKTTFYFNTLLIKDSTIAGSKTHFFNAQIKPIKLNDIAKIQLQR